MLESIARMVLNQTAEVKGVRCLDHLKDFDRSVRVSSQKGKD